MIKLVTVIGARPQVIKAAALSRAIRNKFPEQLKEVIVHTGQHYDENMSAVFFKELQIPQPDYHFTIAGSSPVKQMAEMITRLEEVLKKENPGALVLYGDTNSTLAGAICGSKLNVPVVHIEAGLRSYNKDMPEEINRIACDNVSTFLFSPTKTGLDNLIHEGIKTTGPPPYHVNNPLVYHCGDIMYDNSLFFAGEAGKVSGVLNRYKLQKNNFILATIHRNTNTDVPERLNSLFSAIYAIHHANAIPVILPLHPRTKKFMETYLDKSLFEKINKAPQFFLCEPVSFLDMIMLEKHCKLVLTDSGGVQKEAFYFEKPCIILRAETEWTELVECGAAILADADSSRIQKAWEQFAAQKTIEFPPLFGDGHAAEFICSELVKHLG